MFRRFIDGLISPSNVLNYRNDRKIMTFGIVILYAILMMLPSLISLAVTKPFGYDTKIAIRNGFYNNIEIPYVIENGKLVFVGETEKPQYYVNIDDIELTIVFTTLEEIKVDKEMYNTIIVFDSECVYLYNKLENFRLMNYYEYSNSNNLDFRLAKVDDRMFWNQAFEVIHQVLNNYEGWIMTSAVLIIVFQAFGLVLIITTLLTLFNRLGMKNIYSFGIHWRLMLYYMAPFVLGSLFATLFNVRVFEYIGLIVTLIYSFKINQISFINSDKGE